MQYSQSGNHWSGKGRKSTSHYLWDSELPSFDVPKSHSFLKFLPSTDIF